MAYSDYLHCALCDAKVIYDAEVDYSNFREGQIATLCKDCTKEGWTLAALLERQPGEIVRPLRGLFAHAD